MSNDNLFTKQFSIYEVDLSDDGLGILPCVIIQNNTGNKHSTTTIIMPLATKKPKDYPLCFKIKLQTLGELYVLANHVRCISKSRITTTSSIEKIEDKRITEKLHQYYLATFGMKSTWVSGKEEIVELTDLELSQLYAESHKC